MIDEFMDVDVDYVASRGQGIGGDGYGASGGRDPRDRRSGAAPSGAHPYARPMSQPPQQYGQVGVQGQTAVDLANLLRQVNEAIGGGWRKR